VCLFVNLFCHSGSDHIYKQHGVWHGFSVIAEHLVVMMNQEWQFALWLMPVML